MAFNVGTAFNQFCGSLRFSDNDLSTIQYRYHSITKRINLDYWGSSSDTANSLYVGSFGRDTEIFTSDIDMLIRLPYETYKKFDSYSLNGQSALLQEVKHEQKFSQPARQIVENSVYGPAEDIIGDFSTFELYYGIHLNEDGKIINEDLTDECESDKYIGSIVSLEDLIGRNFYLYSNGQKDESQPFELNLSDLELDTESDDEDVTDEDEDEDDYNDEEDNLSDYLPEKCWVKCISTVEDGYEAYASSYS